MVSRRRSQFAASAGAANCAGAVTEACVKAGDQIAVSLRVAVAPIEHVSNEVVIVKLVRIKGNRMWWSACGTMHDTRDELRVSDRGLTWAPAWREKEVAALQTVVALGGT